MHQQAGHTEAPEPAQPNPSIGPLESIGASTHGRLAKLFPVPEAAIASCRLIRLLSLMNRPSIEHLWSSLWATRFGPNDLRLRFELGGEEFDNTIQQVPRFLQAHRRASTVADALFGDGCVGVVAWNGQLPNPAGLGDGVEDGFVALQSTGFQAPLVSEWQATVFPDPDDEGYVWDFRSYDLGHSKIVRDTLLWHAVASEMPIYPSAPVLTFLLNPSTFVMLHVYDDRGMDVIADDPAKLRGPYSGFADWLLDYDRERMAKMF